MRDIFAAELRLTWHFFSLERDHARALNELAGLETFVPFLFFAFVFPCWCTYLKQYRTALTPLASNQYSRRPKRPQVKTVTHIPLYMTSTYNSKTAVQYHMTPIYNSRVPYIHRSAPISHTFLTALRSTLIARDLYCTPGTSINCPDISTLYRRYI